MTIKQDANGEAESSLESGAQNKVSQISSTPEKDALSEKSLGDVSGGGWPLNTFSSSIYSPKNGG
jgi:hypothetical protein